MAIPEVSHTASGAERFFEAMLVAIETAVPQQFL